MHRVFFDIPATWASAVINDDYSSLMEWERQECKNFLDNLIAEGYYPVSVENYTFIGNYNGLTTELIRVDFIHEISPIDPRD